MQSVISFYSNSFIIINLEYFIKYVFRSLLLFFTMCTFFNKSGLEILFHHAECVIVHPHVQFSHCFRALAPIHHNAGQAVADGSLIWTVRGTGNWARHKQEVSRRSE